MKKAVLDILARDHALPRPVLQCMPHRHLRTGERPIDCAMCSYDIRALLVHALKTNEFLDTWRTDMVRALEES